VINGDVGSVYFATGAVQKFLVTDNQISGYLSASDGAGNETAASNRVIRNNRIGVLQFSGTQEDIPWRNYDVGGAEISQNTIVNGVYSQGKVDLNLSAVAEENSFPEGKVTARTPKGDIRSINVTVQVGEVGWTDKTAVNLTYIQGIYTDVSSAVEDAQSGDSVRIAAGTYTENVTVGTTNVTVSGQGDDTVINGSVALDAADAHLSDVRIESNVGDVFPNPGGANEAVGVAGSNVTVSDVTVNLSVESATFSEGIAIEVYGSDASATVTNATIDGTGEMTADNLTAVVGVSADAGADATVRDSDIDVASDGYSFAVVARGGATTDVRNNELSASGGELDGVGFGVEGDNPGAQTVRFNTFDGAETIENKAGDGELDVTGNYWTDLSDVEFLTDADTFKEAQKGGEITYDPFLTVEPDEVDADSLGETTQFGHDLVISADGDTHSVAFPAATEGTVDEVFGDFNGTVYAYNGTNWVGNEDIADQRISALDAFAVTIDEDESDQRITFEYADADSEIPEMTSTELEAGWNFVAAPSNGTVSNAFGVSTTEVASVVNVVGGPADKSTPYRLAGSDDISPTTVGPFQGYWVFATDDGELGAAVPVGPTQSDEETTLKGN
jgi:hypothetical protein